MGNVSRAPKNKRCAKCNKMQPISSFSKDTGMHDGYKNTCKSCVAAYGRKYREENKAEYKKARKSWPSFTGKKRRKE